MGSGGSSVHHFRSTGLSAGLGDGAGDWFGVGTGCSNTGPLSRDTASRMMPCRRRSWEDMKDAACRSPVQRVISTQSRDSFRRVRRSVRAWRRRGCVEERARARGGWVFRRR